jgi:hypothetical protein
MGLQVCFAVQSVFAEVFGIDLCVTWDRQQVSNSTNGSDCHRTCVRTLQDGWKKRVHFLDKNIGMDNTNHKHFLDASVNWAPGYDNFIAGQEKYQ